MNPFTVNEETKQMFEENICFLINNFIKCRTINNIVFCWIMHEQSIIDAILSMLDLNGVNVICISLTVDAENLTRRLQHDIDNGIRNKDFLQRSLNRLPI